MIYTELYINCKYLKQEGTIIKMSSHCADNVAIYTSSGRRKQLSICLLKFGLSQYGDCLRGITEEIRAVSLFLLSLFRLEARAVSA